MLRLRLDPHSNRTHQGRQPRNLRRKNKQEEIKGRSPEIICRR